jgi:hypothetical protein
MNQDETQWEEVEWGGGNQKHRNLDVTGIGLKG